jgi:hypothetical protein
MWILLHITTGTEYSYRILLYRTSKSTSTPTTFDYQLQVGSRLAFDFAPTILSGNTNINNKQMEFYCAGELQMTACIDDHCVAHLDGRVVTLEHAQATSTLPLDRSLWHRRLGHFHFAGVEAMIHDNVVDDLQINSQGKPDPICVPCL